MNVFHTVKNITREILESSSKVTGKKREEEQLTLNAVEIFLFSSVSLIPDGVT